VLSVGSINDRNLFPEHVLGTTLFKLMYGHRQLLARATPVGYDQIPGAKAVVDKYNSVSVKRDQIDDSRYLKFAQRVTSALRYIVDARNYKGTISTSKTMFGFKSLVGGANGIVTFVEKPVAGNSAYAITATPEKVVAIIESSNQTEEINNLAKRAEGNQNTSGSVTGREFERIANIVDMNVVPFNVHALMRGIPLANLYNYEYTFEQMVAQMFGVDTAAVTAPGGLTDAQVDNTRKMLLKLLVNPYADVPLTQYGSGLVDVGSAGYVHRIFRGDNDLGMGRPKFLSDQLFNKALLGSVYQSKTYLDEAGPTNGTGAGRMDDTVNVVQRAFDLATRVLANMASIWGNEVAISSTDAVAIENFEKGTTLTGGIPFKTLYNTWVNQLTSVSNAPIGVNGKAAIQVILDRLTSNVAAGVAKGLYDTVVGGPTAANLRALLAEFNAATANVVARLLSAEMTAAGGTHITASLATHRARANHTTVTAAAFPRVGPNGPVLTYMKTGSGDQYTTEVAEVSVSPDSARRLEAIGKMRFDTRFIRNMFFITNIVRVLRLKLSRELTQSRNVIVSSHMAVAQGVTEYGADPFTPNEAYDSRTSDVSHSVRFNDRDAD
jgi:hypothetical protein